MTDSACPICLDPLHETSDDAIVTPCQHTFHVKCLLDWNTRSNTCPNCRVPIVDLAPMHVTLLIHEEDTREVTCTPSLGGGICFFGVVLFIYSVVQLSI